MADADRIPQIERFDELRQIIGVRNHIIALPRLARSAMAGGHGRWLDSRSRICARV
jgi:hypothetical protein